MFNGVDLTEVDAAHRVEFLIVGSRVDCDRFLDKSAFLGMCVGLATDHVDDGVVFHVFAGQAFFVHALAVVGVDRTTRVIGFQCIILNQFGFSCVTNLHAPRVATKDLQYDHTAYGTINGDIESPLKVLVFAGAQRCAVIAGGFVLEHCKNLEKPQS